MAENPAYGDTPTFPLTRVNDYTADSAASTPISSEKIDEEYNNVYNAINDLHKRVKYGTNAARPATHPKMYQYWETDTEQMFVNTGTEGTPVWTEIPVIESAAQGDIMYRNASKWVRLAAGTNGHYLQTQGAGANPQWAAAVGFANPMTTAGDIITGGASGAAQRLAVGTEGYVLKVASGVPAWAADTGFANPMTTAGDLILGGASGAASRLAIGTSGYALKSNGTTAAWAALVAADVGLGSVENTALSTWAGSTNLTTLGTIGTGTWQGTVVGSAYGGTGSAYFAITGPTTLRTYTLPDANATLVPTSGATMAGTLAMADNLLTRPEIKDYAETVSTNATSGAAATLNIENGNVFDLTLTANCTLTFSNPSATGKACSFTLYLRQDATGSRTVTWPASVKWPGGTAPTLTTTASRTDLLMFSTLDGGTKWTGLVAAQDVNLA